VPRLRKRITIVGKNPSNLLYWKQIVWCNGLVYLRKWLRMCSELTKIFCLFPTGTYEVVKFLLGGKYPSLLWVSMVFRNLHTTTERDFLEMIWNSCHISYTLIFDPCCKRINWILKWIFDDERECIAHSILYKFKWHYQSLKLLTKHLTLELFTYIRKREQQIWRWRP